jgi:hypothetical protein
MNLHPMAVPFSQITNVSCTEQVTSPLNVAIATMIALAWGQNVMLILKKIGIRPQGKH